MPPGAMSRRTSTSPSRSPSCVTSATISAVCTARTRGLVTMSSGSSFALDERLGDGAHPLPPGAVSARSAVGAALGVILRRRRGA